MRTPGRPPSPTLHPRTRPEAHQIAMKHKAENDWFRHDGKNVEPPPPGHVRLTGPYAGDIADKNKSDPSQWFHHNPKNAAEARPASRCRTTESVQCREKVYGSEEKWYKMEDNMNYHTPRPANRMTTAQGKEVYDKLGRADTMDWYRHSHGAQDAYTAPKPKSRTGPQPQGKDNSEKMRPHGTPNWYSTEAKKGEGMEVVGAKPNRVKTADASEYQTRNHEGNASNWFGHDPTVSQSNGCSSSRVTSPEAETIASRLKGESKGWFNHDENKHYSDPKPNPRGSGAAQDMKEKSKGSDMERALRRTGGDEPQAAHERIKPEAQDIARKSIQGMMDKFLKQDENKGYNSARPCGRAVKGGAAAENAQKSKGVMGDCMGGYPSGQATKKKPGRAVKAGAAENAQKGKGQMDNLMGNYGNLPLSDRKPSRVVKPEAAGNAEKNKGQMGALMNDYGKLQVSGRPAPRCKSQAAEDNAMKGKGSVGSLLGGV